MEVPWHTKLASTATKPTFLLLPFHSTLQASQRPPVLARMTCTQVRPFTCSLPVLTQQHLSHLFISCSFQTPIQASLKAFPVFQSQFSVLHSPAISWMSLNYCGTRLMQTPLLSVSPKTRGSLRKHSISYIPNPKPTAQISTHSSCSTEDTTMSSQEKSSLQF